ncbi:hypothetical protein [Spiroplasma turonicum]|uniref:Lipoprotein n=1 Tax=Spiroplasma turonicum TaxID=216946 RepID=A0A0K1P737_9MOLU|nr:hypothetical protein [Spiroplasma turonicum]AKU80009.1 hypothetical protein STURON_00763 [Spiroplasma turonicum]ALX71011.1 hypothetical protein STURO_v1c07600 [Spiroplasma turonicum]
MKKFLKLFFSLNFLMSSLFTVYSCSATEVTNELTFCDSDSEKNLTTFLRSDNVSIFNSFFENDFNFPLDIENNKLNKDYTDIYERRYVDNDFIYDYSSVEGNQVVMDVNEKGNAFPNEINNIFIETNNLQSDFSILEYSGVTYILTLKGYKGFSNYTIFIYKTILSSENDKDKVIRKTTFQKIYKKNINIIT